MELLKPIPFIVLGNACKHGVCQSPNFCACEVGWEGVCCETCLLLPGCVNGNCTREFECNCYPGWTGAYCDKRKLKVTAAHPPSNVRF